MFKNLDNRIFSNPGKLLKSFESWFVPFHSSGKWIMTRSLDTVLSPRNCTARQTAWQMPRRMMTESFWKFDVWFTLPSWSMVSLNANHWISMKSSPHSWECQDLYTSLGSRFLGARFDISMSMRIRQRVRRVHAQGWTRRFVSVALNCIVSGCEFWILQGTCQTMTCQWFPELSSCCRASLSDSQADRFANDLHTNLTALTQKADADAFDDRVAWNYIEYGLIRPNNIVWDIEILKTS